MTPTNTALQLIASRIAGQVPEVSQEWAEEAAIVAAGTLTKGRGFPWFTANKQRIIDDEGGFYPLVEHLLGRAVLTVLGDSTLSPSRATFDSVDDWKREIRCLYDYRSYTVSYDALVEAATGILPELRHHDPDHSDDTVVSHPMADKITQALPELTTMQREAFELHVAGHTPTAIAEAMGLKARQQAYHLVERARNKIREAIQ